MEPVRKTSTKRSNTTTNPADRLRRLLLSSLLVVGWMWVGLACDRGPSLEDVRGLHAQGQFAASLEPLRALLETAPDDPEVNYLYGLTLNRTSTSPIAKWALRKAAEDPNWSAAANLELAAASVRSGNLEDGIAYASAVLETSPQSIQALSLRGMTYLNEGNDPEAALEDFERILDIDANNQSAMASRAATLLVLGEIEEAAEAIAAIDAVAAAHSAPAATRATLCATRARLDAERMEFEAAEQAFLACLEAHPFSGLVLKESILFFDQTERQGRGTEILRSALSSSPNSSSYRQMLAKREIAAGDVDRAEATLLEGTRLPDLKSQSEAWVALTNLYTDRDDLTAAIAAYRKAIELAQSPSQLSILTLADLLARNEEHAEALEIARSLERDTYRGLIEARVHLNELRPAEALARLDEVLPGWPNNAGARFYAARAAEQLGDFTRAVEEYRQSIRSGPEQTEAALRLARLYYEAGSLKNAWNHAAQHFRSHPDDPAAVRLMLRAVSSGEAESFSRLLSGLKGSPMWPTALAIQAVRVERANGAAAALDFLDGLDDLDLMLPENVEPLRTKVRLLLEAGRQSLALETARSAIKANPDLGELYEVLGSALVTSGAKPSEIRVALERAVMLDPSGWRGLQAAAGFEEREGQTEKALELYRRAATVAPDQESPGRARARLLERMEQPLVAEEAWEKHLREHPWDSEAAAALVALRLASGRQDERTIELAERAVLFRGGEAAQQQLIDLHFSRGETERAQALESAMRANTPLDPTQITPPGG